jgi:hypothetical protein
MRWMTQDDWRDYQNHVSEVKATADAEVRDLSTRFRIN